jgi:hypothetical protein
MLNVAASIGATLCALELSISRRSAEPSCYINSDEALPFPLPLNLLSYQDTLSQFQYQFQGTQYALSTDMRTLGASQVLYRPQRLPPVDGYKDVRSRQNRGGHSRHFREGEYCVRSVGLLNFIPCSCCSQFLNYYSQARSV